MTRVDPDAGGHGTHRPLVVAVRHACALIVVFSVCMLQVLSASAAGAGNLDPSFGGDGTVTADLGGDDFVSHLVVRPDGTILVIGTTFIGDGATGKVMSLSSDGSTDTAFGTDGTVSLSFGRATSASSAALLADGRLVVGGSAHFLGDFGLFRLESDGTLDLTFSGDGMTLTDFGGDDVAADLALQADGKMVLAGSSADLQTVRTRFAVARYRLRGRLDTTFHGDGTVTTGFSIGPHRARSAEASAVIVQPDGKIVAAGTALSGSRGSLRVRFAIVRFNADGTLDTTFSGDGRETTRLFAGRGLDASGDALAIQPDGKIVVGGFAEAPDESPTFALVRYTADGSLDPSFGDGGRSITAVDQSGASIEDLTIQPDGKIVAAGSRGGRLALLRFEADGSLDPSFASDGVTTIRFFPGIDAAARAVVIQPDGAILVGGWTFQEAPEPFNAFDFALARYLGA